MFKLQPVIVDRFCGAGDKWNSCVCEWVASMLIVFIDFITGSLLGVIWGAKSGTCNRKRKRGADWLRYIFNKITDPEMRYILATINSSLYAETLVF